MKIDDDKPIDGEEEKRENSEGKQETNVNPKLSHPEKFENRLTPDDIVDRVSENLRLFREADDFAKKDLERKEKKKKETFELRSGELRTWDSYVTRVPQPYIALYGHDVPFFTEMLRVCALDDRYNPKDFEKPPIMGVLINELIYRRLGGKAIVEAFRARAIVNGQRRYKFSQFVDDLDKAQIIQFIKEAYSMAREYKRGDLHTFRKDYAIRYKVEGFQYRLDV